MKTPVNISIFKKMHRALDYIKYALGEKARSMTEAPSQITYIDCSGYFRYMYHHATEGKVTPPDGSWNQLEWCEQQGFRKLAKYSDVQYAAKDSSRLFACFVKPVMAGRRTIKAGHVWYVYMGQTYESRGGAGVSSRHWNVLFAKVRKTYAFELPVT